MKRKTVLLLKNQKASIIISAGLIVVASCAFGSLATMLLIDSSECVSAKAKLQIGNQFCVALAERMVQEQCSELAEPQMTAECESAVRPFISASCARYIDIERLSSESVAACN
jgi:endogenous inhibitor of DNA gyrase (YacG/DUF329 family)